MAATDQPPTNQPPTNQPPMNHEVTLLTRPGCHLCDDAKEAMARVAARSGVVWREVDITADRELEMEYSDRIPVVLLDGKEHGYWRVEEDRLLRDLSP